MARAVSLSLASVGCGDDEHRMAVAARRVGEPRMVAANRLAVAEPAAPMAERAPQRRRLGRGLEGQQRGGIEIGGQTTQHYGSSTIRRRIPFCGAP